MLGPCSSVQHRGTPLADCTNVPPLQLNIICFLSSILGDAGNQKADCCEKPIVTFLKQQTGCLIQSAHNSDGAEGIGKTHRYTQIRNRQYKNRLMAN
ncbi:hypothetical protein XENTR_v10020594 [Xenopus tropicalis]|nr:hypothetical protein XENTR_v10020594 [Xenopus tropicalis]